MKVAIDLRGLNFSSRTGINTLNLHLFYQLYQLKKNSKKYKYHFTGIGLRQNQIHILSKEFQWFNDLFDDQISIFQYLGISFLIKNEVFIKPINGFLDLIFNLPSPVLKIISKLFQIKEFDILWLTQPKGQLAHSKTKVILSVHDLYALFDRYSLPFAQKLRESKMLYSNLIKMSAKIMTISRATGLDIKSNFETDNIALYYPSLPNWAKISKYNPTQSVRSSISKFVNNNSDYIFAISGVEYRKNWINLIYAHFYNLKNYTDYNNTLVLSGIDIFNQFRHTIKPIIDRYKSENNKDFNPNIIFFENINEEEKQTLIKNCLFMAYPSLYEGFGFPILEAFSNHKSLLTSKISSMPEIAINGAIYINPLDIKDISSGLYVLAKDNDYRLNLEKNGQKRLKDFDWGEFSNTFESVLTNITA